MTSNHCKHFVSISLALAVIAVASAPASAQSRRNTTETASEINAANKLLRDGKVKEALEAFRRVVPGDQQRDELNYNMAVAEYRNGNIDAAEKRFSEVAGTGTPAISSNSRYNLGNCQYAKAVQTAEQDKPAAIEHLRDAVSHYRGALRGNSNNVDARANIELASELIRKLELEQKQQDEQKKQEQQQQDDKKNEDQQQDQKDQAEQKKSDQQEEDDQQDKSQDSESQQSDSRKDESQKNDSQKNDSQKNESQKDDSQKGNEQPKSDQQKPSEQQSQPRGSGDEQPQPQSMEEKSGDQHQPSEEGKPEEQESKNEPVPVGDLKAAGQQDENKNPAGSVAMADPNAKDGLMTREEALKMLQSVRDRDMLRRMQQQRQERSRHVPVDRDW